MTTVTRALHLTDAGAQAADVRRFYAALFDSKVGVLGAGLAVTEKATTADMSVDIAGGFALAAGTQSASQGSYVIENDGVQNATVDAADVTNDRWDLVCAYVTDTDEGAGTSTAVIGVVKGTAAGSPADPTVPANAVVLARVVVGSGVSTIVDANITDLRTTYSGQSTVPVFTDEVATGTAVVDWTPTMANITVGNGTWLEGWYKKDNQHVTGAFTFQLGSTSAITNLVFTLPFAADSANAITGSGYMFDNSTTLTHVGVVTNTGSAANGEMHAIEISGTDALRSNVASSQPFTWATNDRFTVSFSYKSAS